MKTFVFLAIILISTAQSQVMNDAQVLLGGRTGVHISAIRSQGVEDPAVGLSVGIIRGLDLELAAGRSSRSTFVSINAEFALRYKPNISLSIGGHTASNSSGVDATLNISFPVAKLFSIYTGVDGEMNSVNGSSVVPVWYFAGLNAFVTRGLEIFIESDLAVSSVSSNIFSGGMRVYF
jgi:hypothetical protein